MPDRSTNAAGFELDARRGSVASESLDPGTTVDDIFTTTGAGTSSAVLGLREGWSFSAADIQTALAAGEELPLGTILMWHKSLEARGGTARETGTATTDTTDKLIDSSATFVTNNVAAGDIVYNSTDSTYATVQSVNSETQLTLDWDAFPDGNEAYSVFPEPDIQPGWIEMDGSTIDDPDSKYHGMTIEDVVGSERFFRARETAGRLQADAFQGHRHLSPFWSYSDNNTTANSDLHVENIGGSAGRVGPTAGSYNAHLYETDDPRTDGTNGTPRTADETRSINLSIVPIVKIKESADVKLATYYSVAGDNFADLTQIANIAHGDDKFPVWDASASAYKWAYPNQFRNYPPGMLVTHDITANTTSPVGTGVWGTTPLNTVQHNTISGATADISTNHDITVPAGTYFIRFRQFFMRTYGCQARLYNVTAGDTIVASSPHWSQNQASSGDGNSVLGECYVTFTQETTLRLEHIYNYSSPYEIGYAEAYFSLPVEASSVHILQINERSQEVTQNYDQGAPPRIVIEERQTAGTAGGTFTAGAWQKRPFNTVPINEIAGASFDIGTNRLTLPAGKYHVCGYAMGHYVNAHAAKFYNVTNGTDDAIGHSSYTSSSDSGVADFADTITLAQECVFEVQHMCQTTRATDGFGLSMQSRGVTVPYELYGRVEIDQIASAVPPVISYTYTANTPPTMVCEDQKPNNTNGGSATANTVHDRDLNTVVRNEITGASLNTSTGVITLPAGSYEIEFSAPAHDVDRHEAVLWNIDDGVIAVQGTIEFCSVNDSVQTISVGAGRTVITAQKTFRIRHWTQKAYATYGLGVGKDAGSGFLTTNNVFTRVVIKKIA